ncbi:hypothetical protein DL766_006964 [Monosporascus sp. MC13-8B]|uniref:Ubiquitin-like protease family profile domain-containing protein n=1 Tax=Monosporascus cannonballus TaxID=155416 RepID=A0ABY0H899_9PEZI|nr:hypothetical protein DL763_006706 [Monosporascus cannonballus]RYO87378.1 hypothetical protein DL762_004308 [Monosporascus cannonballus]RYP25639.1 hypothetical protein DL766_006964 [Monosporascus sp. MC13-8B]
MVWTKEWTKSLGSTLGAHIPKNTLSEARNQTTSSSRPMLSATSGRLKPNPPPSKRQKVRGNAHAHAEAQFVLQPQFDGPSDSVVPRKRSVSDSVHSVNDSYHTVSGQPSKGSSQNVPELRQISRYTDGGRSAKRARYKQHKNHNEGRSITVDTDSRLDHDPLGSDGDDEVAFVRYSTASSSQQQPREGGRGRNVGIVDIAARFQRPQKVAESLPASIASAPRKGSLLGSTTQKRVRLDHDPDELALDHSRMSVKNPKARVPPASTSLSKEGDVERTRFTGTKTRQQQSQTAADQGERDLAAEIICSGLGVKRAVDGQYGYPGPSNEAPECLLSVREISHILHPTDRDRKILEQYSYLKVNLQKVHHITHSLGQGSCIVLIRRMKDTQNTAESGRLYLEFSSLLDTEKFLNVVLEKGLDNCFKNVVRSTTLRDTAVPDDIKLIMHNSRVSQQGSDATMNKYPRTQAAPRKKLKDQMQPAASSTEKDDTYVVPESPPQSDEPHPVRTTRSTFTPKDPTPEPDPPSWTASNPGWEQAWRNSLVFPPRGKSRATVDKGDIERLDEGQFLNDNLIIFYLRYLQHKLETELPDQAQRIYFQNTFFFDKLKPTRAGGPINYESVKGWTSKVDLFTKDFIIVPINEYSHWYVAIIYNAPRLIPSEPQPSEPHDDVPRESIVIEDDTNTPQGEKAPEITNSARAYSDAQSEVEAGISRMSISNSEHAEKETKQTDHHTDHHPQQQASRPSRNDLTINLTREPSDPTPEVEQTQPSGANLGRKKTAKRQSGGSRRNDPDQPRIITLDSLGGSHSPACNFLKQYLVAELGDKKGIEISAPGALGMTAKRIPLQSNYCDCGLYLLGYIQEFLRDPDRFIRSVLQQEDIPWNLNPSDLRNDIRDVIFELQREQQERENAHKEEKRRVALAKQNKSSRPSSSEGPQGNECSAKPGPEAETSTAQKVAESSPNHDATPQVEDVTPRKVVDTSAMFHAHGQGKDRSSSAKDASAPVSDGTETPRNVAQNMSPSIPEVHEGQSPPPRGSNGDTAASPPHEAKKMATDPTRRENVLSSNTDSTEENFLSPIRSSPVTPPHKHKVAPESGKIVSAAKTDNVQDVSVEEKSEKRGIGVYLDSARRHRKTHPELHPDSPPRTSRHFAGRQDGDTRARAKCTPKPVQTNTIVELSD